MEEPLANAWSLHNLGVEPTATYRHRSNLVVEPLGPLLLRRNLEVERKAYPQPHRSQAVKSSEVEQMAWGLLMS